MLRFTDWPNHTGGVVYGMSTSRQQCCAAQALWPCSVDALLRPDTASTVLQILQTGRLDFRRGSSCFSCCTAESWRGAVHALSESAHSLILTLVAG